MLKLHVGCGSNILKNWVNIDKFVHNKNVFNYPVENLPYDSESVDYIYSSHMIEHLMPDIRTKALIEWYRVLKPNGKLIIRCPYAPFYLQQWLDYSPEERLNINCILGIQDRGEGMFNHGLFCDQSLSIIVKKPGFKIQELKITTPRTFELTQKIRGGHFDTGEDVPNLDKCDIYCVAIK